MLNVSLKSTILVTLLGMLAALSSGSQDTAPETSPNTAPAEANQEMQMPKPGPMHKWLASREGTWKVKSKMRMAPGAPWLESEGTETSKMGCGGFWQFTVQKGSMMGMPFEGRMQLGYDTYKKKFVGTWVDNFGPNLSTMEGTLSADKKTLTLHSSMYNPMTGKDMKMRMVTTIESKDKATFKMFMPGPDGKEFQNMEQTSTRMK